jgi:hypothetical protein
MNSSRWFTVFCLGLTCGCSSVELSKCKSLWPAGPEKPQQPVSVVAIWTEGVVHQGGSPPLRGFAGRLIFYGGDGTKPVKVDGGLTVYAFDEAGRRNLDAKPDRKYVFTPEQLATHYDKLKVGPAYAVWIPWDEAGGPSKDISLIVRFSPRGGQLVVGEMTRVVLTGTTQPAIAAAPRSPDSAAPPTGDLMVRRMSYESPIPGQPGELPAGEPGAAGIRSTTIQLPDGLTRQLAAARPANSATAQRVGGTTIVQPGVAGSMAGAAGLYRQTSTANYPAPAAFPPSPPTGLREAHSSLGRPRVPGVLVAPLTRDHAALRPHPAGPPYLPEPSPPPGTPATGASTLPAGP